MASLCASSCWAAPVTVAAASPSTRPARVTLSALPRGRNAPSPAPLLKIQLGRRPGGAFFLSRCLKGADRHLEPESESEPEPLLEQPDVVEIFSKIWRRPELSVYPSWPSWACFIVSNAYVDLFAKHVPPEMFRKQKDEILGHLRKIRRSKPDILPADTDGISKIVCENALLALSLASMVMDMPSLGLGTNEISQQTVHQMVRVYAATFCKAAEDASQKRVQMETICSFYGALGCLGAIAHMLVQDTVANLEDGRLKSKITQQLDTDYHQFRKEMNVLSEEFKMDKPTEILDKILLDALVHAKSYVSKLIKDASSPRRR
uniref:Uncharacterized protein n=1 Tax=Avena sativa TaxID=4498 RepID=A0ACD5UKK2_AVESA